MSKEILLNKLEKQFSYYELVDEMQETINYSKIIDFLDNEKDQKIADLEAKLAESEKLTERLQQIVDKLRDKEFAGKSLVEAVNAVYEPLYQNKYDEAEELKQQLAEKNKEIEKVKEVNLDVVKKQIEFYKDQDKISFAVDKLKKLKDRLSSMQWCFTGRRNFLQEVEFMRKSQEEMIDEEIEDLTHQHEDKGE